MQRAVASLAENPQKFGILLLLLAQNTGLALAVKSSKSGGATYIPSTAVVLNELVKFLLSAYMYRFKETHQNLDKIEKPSFTMFFRNLLHPEHLPFLVPCLIYACQNNLIFYALQLIDAALYQVLSNLKIITTAVFSVVMLKKSLHRLQWLALILLATGEALAESSSKKGENSQNVFTGTMIMIFYAALSGFAGVFTERILKRRGQLSFWAKSMLLYFWGVIINLLFMFYQDWSEIAENGFFYGYNWKVWLVVFLLSFGGILVSVVITQFDNLVKVYVTCVSLFLTSIFSYVLFDFQYNMQFLLSAVIVSISIIVYSDPVTQQQS